VTPFTDSELLLAREGLSVDEALVFDSMANEARGMDAAVELLEASRLRSLHWGAVYYSLTRLYCH
jgi:hypothetical protein